MKFQTRTAKIKDGRELIVMENAPENAAKTLEYLGYIGKESENLYVDEDWTGPSVEDEESFIASCQESTGSIMLVGLLDDTIVSLANLNRVTERKRGKHRAELAISVRKDYWGLGVGTEMIAALFDFARSIGIDNIHLEVLSSNTSAIGLYKKMGFEKVGELKDFSRLPDRDETADIMQALI